MELNKENMRKIRKLILFTALLIVVLAVKPTGLFSENLTEKV